MLRNMFLYKYSSRNGGSEEEIALFFRVMATLFSHANTHDVNSQWKIGRFHKTYFCKQMNFPTDGIENNFRLISARLQRMEINKK